MAEKFDEWSDGQGELPGGKRGVCMSQLSTLILRHLVTERGPLLLATLIADTKVLPEFIEQLESGWERWDIRAAVLELVIAGKVRRIGVDGFEAVPEAEWPMEKPKGVLFV